MIGALIGAGASLLGGLFGSSSAKKAAQIQAAAMDRATQSQREMFETTRQDMMPWLRQGETALDAYMGELGYGGPGFQSQFTETPAYQFQVEQGERGVLNNLSALGMRDSGAALKSLERFRQGLASQEYGNYLSRLGGVAGMGQGQSGALGELGSQYSQGIANSIAGAGTARASGYVGAGNALMGGMNSAANFLGQANWGGSSGNQFPAAPAPVRTDDYYHNNAGLW